MAEEAAATAQRRFWAVWIGGSVITGLLCGLSAAVFHTAWIMPVLVLLGAGVLTTLFFVAWWRDPLRGRTPSTVTKLEAWLLLLLSCIFLGLFSFILVLEAATTRLTSVNLPATGWDQLAWIAFGGAGTTMLLAPVLCGCVMAIILLQRGNHGDSVKRP